MLPEARDAAYLWDMLDAARQVLDFTARETFESYSRNRMLQLAVERAIEIIGEAARHVSEGFRTQHAEIAWPKIIAQRNVLAHEYGEIRNDRIWFLVQRHIPELIEHLSDLIPPRPDDPVD